MSEPPPHSIKINHKRAIGDHPKLPHTEKPLTLNKKRWYGSCRDKKDVLSCITSQHWKCSKIVAGLVCRSFHALFGCTLKLAYPSSFLKERSGGLFHHHM